MGIYEFKREDALNFSRELGFQAKIRGDELQFRYCPYCNGGGRKDNGTFSINLVTGLFKCLRASCNAHGNMITLARDFNFSLGNDVDEYFNSRKKYRTLTRSGSQESKPAAVQYMQSRGISEAVTTRYGITVRNDNDKVLVFPFTDEKGILQFVKYRKTDFNPETDSNKEWCERDCKPILFGMNQCDTNNKTLVLTEGQIDSLSVAEAGIANAVSVPTGAKGFTWIPYCWDWLQSFDTLIVFGDHEHGHITLLEEMKTRFHGTIKHVREKDYLGCKDANEILQKHGKNAIVNAIQNAEAVPVEYLKKMEDVQRVDPATMEHFGTGIPNLDKMIGGFYFGQLIVISGARGLGKSTLAQQFLINGVAAGHNAFIYSGEMPDWMIRDWFDRQVAGPAFINSKIASNGFVTYSVHGSALALMENWYKERVYIYDIGAIGDKAEEVGILEIMEKAITQYACRVILIDNLMTALTDDMKTDIYKQQSAFVKRLVAIAKKYKVCIFLVAHPRKSNVNSDDSDKIAGSSDTANLANIVLSYDRATGGDDPNTTDRILKVWKNRTTGKVSRDGMKMFFDEASKRISMDPKGFDWKLGWEPDGDFLTLDDDYVEVPF